jgi:PKD repeat protein
VCQEVVITCSSGIVPQLTFTSSGLELMVTNTTTAATQFAWTFGDGQTSQEKSPVHQFLEEGTYQVCVTQSNLCGSVTTCSAITIACFNPAADFEFTFQEFEATFSNNSISATSFIWDFGDGSTSTEEAPSHTYSNNGVYMVCLQARNHCNEVSQKCHEVAITVTGLEAGASGITISPNPFSETFIVSSSYQNILSVDVYSQTGIRVAATTSSLINGDYKISLGEQASGIYLVRVTTTLGLAMFKVIQY